MPVKKLIYALKLYFLQIARLIFLMS